ncbi:MAG: lipopolysaccharide transport periplasmic protein LptA [Pseudomonadales bacterium]|nr:lipopolysaccharide transport periplasmic protein LptA [Pseudomonadales bacterium]MDG1444347.1 lipopolysaccharide transport periplasmic protein LptA [Pseudomonadales bacterium]
MNIRIFFVLFVFLFSGQTSALESDREQDINIESNSMIADDQSGITIYSGRVTIDQGTLHIDADEVRVISNATEVVQIIASMDADNNALAHYQQEADDNEGLIKAHARLITYFVQKERIHLAGSAFLEQTNDTFRGELLHYDVASGTVDLKGGSKENGGRVNVVLTPKSKK